MKRLIFFLVLNSFVVLTAQNKFFYGMTSQGGKDGVGAIIKTDANGNNPTIVHEFESEYPGGNPQYGGLIQFSDGKFYGVTAYGGAYDAGVLFQYDPITGSYNRKMDFDYTYGKYNGGYPLGSLFQGADGKLYGMTSLGGTNDKGVLFQYDPVTGDYTKKIDFDGINGANPQGALIKASDGNLYGMTINGGLNYVGVIFQYDPAIGIYTKKIDFGQDKGSGPIGSLIQGSDDKLYGMTSLGGTNGKGVLFQYNPVTGDYTKKIDFDGINGANPRGTLIKASDGNLYGMTSVGGINNKGVLFQYDPVTGIYDKKIDFDGASNGANPYDSLIQGNDGKLYGMTNKGGINDMGVLFEFNPVTGIYNKKLDFDSINSGANPFGSLLKSNEGKLYGMTNSGGTSGKGVLFQFDPITENYSKKIDFEGANNGAGPQGSLMQGSDGKLYGMTYKGGTNDLGVLFRYDPITEIYSKKMDFNGTNNGANPFGSLIQANDNKIYGMTGYGGINDKGVIFQYDPITGIYNKKIDFDGTNNGAIPRGSLVQGSDNKLYGMTLAGGAMNWGVLFQFDPVTGNYNKKIDFDFTSKGARPFGTLLQGSDGSMYGMTVSGGINSSGVLFKYNLSTEIYSKIIDFKDFNGNDNIGSNPYGSLMQASNGKIYGMTFGGGTFFKGVLFEYNLITNDYSIKSHFNCNNGANPYKGDLIEVNLENLGTPNIGFNENLTVCYPNPFAETFTLNFTELKSERVKVTVYDLLGKVIEKHNVLSTEIEKLRLGTNYPSGIYNVLIEQGMEKEILKVVKE